MVTVMKIPVLLFEILCGRTWKVTRDKEEILLEVSGLKVLQNM
jgi:hypothetical protein